MISYADGTRRFNYRIAAIIIDDGHLLVHRGDDEPFWAVPGGRAELGEDAADTVRREMREELGEDVRVERLVWLAENFFHYNGHDHHELGLYWLAHLPACSPWLDKTRDRTVIDGAALTFRWVPLASLADLPLMPAFLAAGVRALPAGITHVVVR